MSFFVLTALCFLRWLPYEGGLGFLSAFFFYKVWVDPPESGPPGVRGGQQWVIFFCSAGSIQTGGHVSVMVCQIWRLFGGKGTNRCATFLL